jgi:uncharacterized RDD family membrane protein YckC
MPSKNAGFAIRTLALLLDTSISATVLILLPSYVYFLLTKDLGIESVVNSGLLLLGLLFSLSALYVFYQTYFISKFGGTPGKLLCGLQVRDYETGNRISMKTAFLRQTAGYAFSSQFFGLGFYMITRSKENRAWHDELFNTVVLREGVWWYGLISYLLILLLKGYIVFEAIKGIAEIF